MVGPSQKKKLKNYKRRIDALKKSKKNRNDVKLRQNRERWRGSWTTLQERRTTRHSRSVNRRRVVLTKTLSTIKEEDQMRN